MSARRTKTYLAGDWDDDKVFIDELYRLNDNNNVPFHFVDAHSMSQARDESLSCSIKKNLAQRMDASKTFLLVVGDHTSALTRGCCFNCGIYDSSKATCPLSSNISHKSFIDFECDKAVRDGLDIIVVYNSATVNRTKCPESVRYRGSHIPGYMFKDGRKQVDWLALYIQMALS